MSGRLNESQLKRVMRYYLARVAGEPDWERVSEVIPQTDYIPDRGSEDDPDLKDLYRGGVMYALKVYGHGNKDWPDGWPSKTIAELAPIII
jgi:hypothetical protein